MPALRTLPKVAAVAAALALVAIPLVAIPLDLASAAPPADTGFGQPFAGVDRWVSYSATEARTAAQVNETLGQKRADSLAANLGFDKAHAMTRQQYATFMSGRGRGGGGEDAKVSVRLIEASVRYLTNANGTRMYRDINGKRTRVILGSYGLIVNRDGKLESPAHGSSPVRQVNWVLAPKAVCRVQQPPPELNLPEGTCGYMGRWLAKNAPRVLKELYGSAYTSELPYGSLSQESTEPHETLPNTKGGTTVYVGMPMAPAIYIVNFLLIYALNPRKAANMPAYWAPIPAPVAAALQDPANKGQVPYARYMHLFT
ncbi:MAG: hypothetical protein ACR2KE_05460 [Candidatus Nanopelagicales bacterium]